MPYINVATNVSMDDATRRDLAGKFSRLGAELLGKPEKWVMARVEAGCSLVYSGTDEPAAFVDFRSIGLDENGCVNLSQRVCALLRDEADIDPSRVYIDFRNLERKLFGWNEGTF